MQRPIRHVYHRVPSLPRAKPHRHAIRWYRAILRTSYFFVNTILGFDQPSHGIQPVRGSKHAPDANTTIADATTTSLTILPQKECTEPFLDRTLFQRFYYVYRLGRQHLRL